MSVQISWVTESSREQPEGGDQYELNFSFINLDILESESYDSKATVTAHAVEEGIPTTDHIVLQNDKTSFLAVVSDRQSSTAFVDDAKFGTFELSNGTEVSGVIIPEGTDRRGDVFDVLLELKNNGTRISITGLQRIIDDWIIESISYPRSVDTAGTLVCNISITEIKTAVLEEVDAPSPRVERGRNRSNNGRSDSDDSDDSEDSELQSVADSLSQGALERLRRD